MSLRSFPLGEARLWQPPSFDPPPMPASLPAAAGDEAPSLVSEPPPQEPVPESAIAVPSDDAIRAWESEARSRGEALGHAVGFERGQAEGHAQGWAEGLERGRQQALDDWRPRLEALEQSLADALAQLRTLPEAMADPVVELALNVAERLAGARGYERATFMQAVQEALARLPTPGEQLELRVGPEDAELWRQTLAHFDLHFGHVVRVEPDLPPGHASVWIAGARLDVGMAAREALVRAALGLEQQP